MSITLCLCSHPAEEFCRLCLALGVCKRQGRLPVVVFGVEVRTAIDEQLEHRFGTTKMDGGMQRGLTFLAADVVGIGAVIEEPLDAFHAAHGDGTPEGNVAAVMLREIGR